MSRSLTDLALLIPCAYCGVAPGQPCVTRIAVTRRMSREDAIKHYGPSGRSSSTHAARSRPVFTIWQAGRYDVLEDEHRAAPPAR